jgi:hypothetical protein
MGRTMLVIRRLRAVTVRVLTMLSTCARCASNGATATASSTYSGAPAPASNTNNGDHVGTASWWADDTSNTYPDTLQVEFAGSKTIGEIDVYGLQQNYSSPVEPTATMTSSYALTNFEVQYWTGSAWAVVPGGSVTGNDRCGASSPLRR